MDSPSVLILVACNEGMNNDRLEMGAS